MTNPIRELEPDEIELFVVEEDGAPTLFVNVNRAAVSTCDKCPHSHVRLMRLSSVEDLDAIASAIWHLKTHGTGITIERPKGSIH